MCGITGFSGLTDKHLLHAMVQAISHRGPDNLGEYLDTANRLGLGHARLSIIDLSRISNQPLWDATGRYCIVFNGEIYNYQSLRRELKQRGYQFASNGDAEVLLNTFIAYGEEALNRLSGIFAFCIWDKEEKLLFLARDQLGVKPLYYAQTPTGFLFASEMKSLLCDPSLSRELDYGALSLYLKYLWCPSPLTPLKQVKKLEPGTALVVKDGRIISLKQYYRLPVAADAPALAMPLSASHYKQELLNTLDQAVERQLVADVRVGCFLSGGLDSSAIAALAARKVGAANLPCYTIDFEGAEAEGMQADLPYAKRVAAHLGVPLEVVKVTPDAIRDYAKLIFHLDEPQADIAPLNALYICELARKQGVKVLLSGAGGDDLLSGYRRHYALVQERYWSWLPQPLRGLIQQGALALPQSHPLCRRISKALGHAGLEPNERLNSYFHWLHAQSVAALFKEPLPVAADPFETYAAGLPASLSPLEKMLQLETRFFLVDHNLNYTDKVSMSTGVEVRVPLVDRQMVELAARIPDCFKQRGTQGKWIFKQAMEGILPHDVIYRPKTGFGAPVRPWIRNQLSSLVDELLSSRAVSERGIFDELKVQELIARDRQGKIDGAYTILALMSIELWCRQFIDSYRPVAIFLPRVN